jgi:hypothetical protein
MAELLRVIPQVVPQLTLGSTAWGRRKSPLAPEQVLFVKIGAILPFERSLSSEEWGALVLRLVSGGIKGADARALLARLSQGLRAEFSPQAPRLQLGQYPALSRCVHLRRILESAFCSQQADAEPQVGTVIEDADGISFLCASLLMLSISLDAGEKLNILSRIFNHEVCCQQVSDLAGILIEESRHFLELREHSGKRIDSLREAAEQGLSEITLPGLFQSEHFSAVPSPTAKRSAGPHFVFEEAGDLP